MAGPVPGRGHKLDLFAVCAVGSVTSLLFLGQEEVWSGREITHAAIALAIHQSGEYLVPRLAGEVYYDKPPVLHSSAALLMSVFGPSLFAVRFPSAVAGLIGALATYALGCRLHGRRTALLAALGLFATPLYAHMARNARPDMILTAAVMVSAYALTAGMEEAGRARRASFFALGGLASGLATLTKGPYGLLFPLVSASFNGVARGVRRPRLVELALAVAGFLFLPAVWALSLHMHGGDEYLLKVLLQEDLLSGASQHSRPFYYYLGPFLWAFLPFVVFVPFTPKKFLMGSPCAKSAALFFVVLSCVPGKRLHYLLPWLPFAILAETSAIHASRSERLKRSCRLLVILFVVAMPVYNVVLHMALPMEPRRALAEEFLEATPAGATVVCYMGMLAPFHYVAHERFAAKKQTISGGRGPAHLASILRSDLDEGEELFLVVDRRYLEECAETTRSLATSQVLLERPLNETAWSLVRLTPRPATAAPREDP